MSGETALPAAGTWHRTGTTRARAQNPASVAPGANDSVTINAAAGGATHVITGTGKSASLTIAGPTTLAGQFTTGTFNFNYDMAPIASPSLGLNAGDTLTVTGSATFAGGGFDIGGGALTIDGALTASGYNNEVTGGGAFSVAGNLTAQDANYQVAGGNFTVGGTFAGIGEGEISGTAGARIQLANVSGNVYLSVDSASSLEIGKAGGAALGAITVDPGVTTTLSGEFTAPSIVDNGAIVVAAGASLVLDGGVFTTSYPGGVYTLTYASGGLTGTGQVDIGAGSNLTVEGVNPASTNTIDFTGAGGVLTIPGSALNGSKTFVPTISGFNASDAIDFDGTVTSASYASGVLTLMNGTTLVAKLELSGVYAGETFYTLPLTPSMPGPGETAATQISLFQHAGDVPPGVSAPTGLTVYSGNSASIGAIDVTDFDARRQHERHPERHSRTIDSIHGRVRRRRDDNRFRQQGRDDRRHAEADRRRPVDALL